MMSSAGLILREYFAGDQKNPVSPVDGYEYSFEELSLLRIETGSHIDYMGEFTVAVRRENT